MEREKSRKSWRI